jgi:Icc-related predicted phosphoesterase
MAYGIPQPELTGDRLLKRVASIRKHYKSYDDYQLAAALGLPLEIYTGRVTQAESEHREKMRDWSLGTPMYLTGSAIVLGDVHCPFTDWTYSHLVTKIAKHLPEPRQLVIAGDLFNLDIFSDYAKLVSGPGWHEEKEAARAIVQEWVSEFDHVYFLAGNHDRRVSRRTDGELDIRDLVDFLSVSAAKFTPSLFGYCALESNGTIWRITHAKQYSVNRLTVAGELALKFQSNVITFHEHHQAIGWDRFGRYCIINGGSLVRQDEMAYAVLDDTKYPNWNTGFVMIRDGYPTLFGKPPITRWEDWL